MPQNLRRIDPHRPQFRGPRSCVLPVSLVGDRPIVTIEAIVNDAVGRVVQDAWEDVVQCGYCQSGQIMTAVALLKSTRRPTNADIEESMGGNLAAVAPTSALARRSRRLLGTLQEVCDDAGCSSLGWLAAQSERIYQGVCAGGRRAALTDTQAGSRHWNRHRRQTGTYSRDAGSAGLAMCRTNVVSRCEEPGRSWPFSPAVC
jgi:hypothetical protein